MPYPDEIRLLLAGDVMLGRGIDQALPRPGDPRLYESWRGVEDARYFVERSTQGGGPLPEPRSFDYVWGETLAAMEALKPDLRLVNLETAVTARGAPEPGKKMHFRMNPENVATLSAAKIDLCALANNHLLDWGEAGLRETIATLERAGIGHCGAGRDREAASAPAVVMLPGKGRVLVVSLATTSSGCPPTWAAGLARAGINLIELDPIWFEFLKRRLAGLKQPGDLLIASIHWGDNFQFAIPPAQQAFARRLIDALGFDLIHGHSSHHAKGIELYRGKPILYGCGDLINDYQTFASKRDPAVYAHDLGALYLARFSLSDRRLLGLELRPTRMRRLRAEMATADDRARLAAILDRECARLGTRVVERNGALSIEPRRAEGD